MIQKATALQCMMSNPRSLAHRSFVALYSVLLDTAFEHDLGLHDHLPLYRIQITGASNGIVCLSLRG